VAAFVARVERAVHALSVERAPATAPEAQAQRRMG
jgi:hypothetical protein